MREGEKVSSPYINDCPVSIECSAEYVQEEILIK